MDVINGTSGNDILTGTDLAEIIRAFAGNDTIRAEGGDDVVEAGEGSDVIFGGTGTNRLFGEGGNDIFGNEAIWAINFFDGGLGVDTLITRASLGETVTVDLLKGTVSGGFYDGSTLVDIETLRNGSASTAVVFIGNDADNSLSGGLLADILRGGGGVDALLASSGNDLLDGGAGSDQLTGGAGYDRFLLRRGETHGDRIIDFAGGGAGLGDRLLFEGFGLNAYMTSVGTSFTIHFAGGSETFTMNTSSWDPSDIGFGPTAQSDLREASENESLTIDVLANDVDPEGLTLKVISASAPPGKGGVSVVEDKLLFDPGAAFDGLVAGAVEEVLLTYAIEDADGLVSSSFVTVRVTGTNDGTVLASIAQPTAVSELSDASAQDIAPISGSLSFSDADIGQTVEAQIMGAPWLLLNGGTTFPSSVNVAALTQALVTGKLGFGPAAATTGGNQSIGYSYDPAAANLDFLAAGDILTISYDVSVGDSAPQALTFNVTGTGETSGGGGGTPADIYYLEVEGLDGGVLAKGHEGAFTVANFSFGVTNSGSSMVGGGGGAGKAGFAPLVVQLDEDAHLTDLWAAAATGKHLKAVSIDGVTLGGSSQIVYDLRLEDVLVTRITDTSGADHLEFSYSQISLTTYDQKADGSLGAPQTWGYDLIAGKATGQVVDAQAKLGLGGIAHADDFYLTVAGVKGGVTTKGFEGAFDVLDFVFSVTNLTSLAAGGGGGVGRADFAPILIDLAPGASLVGLLGLSATGKHSPSVVLEGVSAGADQQIVYALELEDVLVTQVFDTNGVGQLALSYGSFELTTRTQNSKGTYDTQITSYDVAGAKLSSAVFESGAGELAGAAQSELVLDEIAAVAAAAPAQAYYLEVEGLDGGVLAKGHEGAFTVANFSFGVTNSGSTMVGAGGGAGKAGFAPLVVQLDEDAHLTDLWAAAATGKHLKAVSIDGVTLGGSSQVVYDLRLEDVLVTRITDTSGADHLEFSYSQISLTTYDQKADGSLGAPQTWGYDLIAGKATGQVTDAQAKLGLGGIAHADDFYLTVAGLKGGVTTKGFEGAFDVNDFVFSVTNLGSLAAGGGGGAGRADFAPILIDLAPGASLVGLLGLSATGKHSPSVVLEGVSAGADQQIVYALELEDVLVTQVFDTNGVGQLALSYGSFELTTRTQNSKGTYDTQITSYDVAEAKLSSAVFESGAGELAGAAQSELVLDEIAAVTAAAPAQAYYLEVEGLDGGVLSKGHEGAFTVANFSFGVTNSGSTMVGGGGGAGKAGFAPLVVQLDEDAHLTDLWAAAATGKHLKAVSIDGVTLGGSSQVVYDLRLEDVLVTRITDTSGADHLEFSYSQISLTTYDQKADGSLGAPQTWGYDLIAGKATGQVTDAQAKLGLGGIAHADDFYLTVAGLKGGVTTKGFEGAFDVLDFVFSVTNLTSLAAGGGGGVGRADFAPILIDLAPGASLVGLLGLSATGKHSPSVVLEGVSAGADQQIVYALELEDVLVTQVFDTNGVGQLALSYGSFELTTRTQNSKGTYDTQITSYDVAEAKLSSAVFESGETLSDNVPTELLGSESFFFRPHLEGILLY